MLQQSLSLWERGGMGECGRMGRGGGGVGGGVEVGVGPLGFFFPLKCVQRPQHGNLFRLP